MQPDLVSAVVAYLRIMMATQFGVNSTNFGVWADKSDQDTYPFCVISDVSEQYERSSNDPSTGAPNMYLADGILHAVIFTQHKQNARIHARQIMTILGDNMSQGALDSTEGTILEMVPMSAASLPVDDSGTLSAVVYRRLVVFHYKQEFYF